MIDNQGNFKASIEPIFIEDELFLVVGIKCRGKDLFIGTIHGQRTDKKSIVGMNMGHIVLGGHL